MNVMTEMHNPMSVLGASKRAELDRDGAICVRQAVSAADVEMLREEIAFVVERDSPNLTDHTKRNKGKSGRFVSAFKIWFDRPRLAEFTHNSNMPALVGELMGADRVNLFFDQCFVKEPGTADPTPWHQDQPFWPLQGNHVVTTWIALDHVTRDSGGVEFVAGSHKWSRWFQAKSFSGENELERHEAFEEVPDIEADRSAYDIISWDLDPGDMLVFNGMTLHGAAGNASGDKRRRGYAIRYTGSNVIYDPRPGCTQSLYNDSLVAGGPLDGSEYPVVWRRD